MTDDADNEFFKKLLGLVPAHYTQLGSDDEKDVIIHQAAGYDRAEIGTGSRKAAKKRKRSLLNSESANSQEVTLNAMEEKIQGKKKSKQKKKKKAEKDKPKPTGNTQKGPEKLQAKIAERKAQGKKGQGLNNSQKQQQQTRPSQKPIVNSEGKLVFSKFDFTKSGEKEKNSGQLTGKDFKRILSRLEQRDAKVAKVKETDADAATKLERKHILQDVLSKAKGEKIKDDPNRLKKAIKRKEKMKDQRKKKWENRQKTVETQQAKRQEKRQQNVQKRQDDKKAKHRKKLIKKGRILPGF